MHSERKRMSCPTLVLDDLLQWNAWVKNHVHCARTWIQSHIILLYMDPEPYVCYDKDPEPKVMTWIRSYCILYCMTWIRCSGIPSISAHISLESPHPLGKRQLTGSQGFPLNKPCQLTPSKCFHSILIAIKFLILTFVDCVCRVEAVDIYQILHRLRSCKFCSIAFGKF